MSVRLSPVLPSHNGYAPTAPVQGLAVIKTGTFNAFNEDVGAIIAYDARGNSAPVKVDLLAKSLGLQEVVPDTSLSDKVAFLSFIERLGHVSKLHIVLEEPFKTHENGHPPKHALEHFSEKKVLVDYFPVTHALPSPSDRLFLGLMRLGADRIMTKFASNSTDGLVASAFYDKIFEIFNYTPPGGSSILSKTSYFQLIPNGIPVSLDRLVKRPPMSPFNPQGDMTTTEEFSMLASQAFDPNGRPDSNRNVEKAFGAIIHGANAVSDWKDKEESIEVLKKVDQYLHTTVKDPFTGEEFLTDTMAYANYKKCYIKYNAAIAAYVCAKNSYNLLNPEDQRKWQAESIMLQVKIDEAKNELDSAGITVEKALRYQKTHGNNAVEYVLSSAKDDFDNSAVTSQVTRNKYHVSYGLPSTWYEDNSGFSSFKFSSSEKKETASKEYESYGASTSFSYGLFSVGADMSSSTERERSHSDSSEITFSFELGTVLITRTWMDTTIFSLDNWELGGQKAGKISGGVLPASDPLLNEKLLPYYATALVIAKNVNISGNWGSKDSDLIKKATEGKMSVGIGPFSISGHYSHSSSDSVKLERNSDGSLTIPGAQIIGVINDIVPFAAPK